MGENKFLKGKCKKTGLYYGLDVKQYGSVWKVVNMVRLTDAEARVAASEIRQDRLETHTNLLACTKCGNRVIGGCKCPPKTARCKAGMGYKFDCVYCDQFEIDYSRPSMRDMAGYQGDKIKLSQGMEVAIVTFSNVEWDRFDNIKYHEPAPMYQEPRHHVITDEEDIEFHGYNISAMDEGVCYTIGKEDDFEIECDVNTSSIKPHPGGCFYISFGEIRAEIGLEGGSFFLSGSQVATIGNRFHMVLARSGGSYSIQLNGRQVGVTQIAGGKSVKIVFGFRHDSHHCEMLSHAYMKGIKMMHGKSKK